MKVFTAFTAVALLWGGAALANDFTDAVRQAYVAAGYSHVTVSGQRDHLIVISDVSGATHSFPIDRKSGVITPLDLVALTGKHRQGADDNGADDNGASGSHDDGVGHDVGEDHGTDAAGHDAGDDHGGSTGSRGGSGNGGGHGKGGDGANHG